MGECSSAGLSSEMALKGIIMGIWSISQTMPTAIIETVRWLSGMMGHLGNSARFRKAQSPQA